MKSPFRTSPFLLLLCVVIISSSALAQEATVNLRFVSFPKAANPEPIKLLIGEGKTIEVEMPTNSLSVTYKVPALSTWSLGKSTVDEEGKPSFQAYGKIKSNGANEQLVLVIRKGANDADGLVPTSIKNDNKEFGGGKYIVMNATGVDIAGAIGTGKFSLKPSKFTIVSPKPTKITEGRQYCFSQFFFRQGEETQPFFSATWRFNVEARSMVFFYHDPNTKQLRVHTIRSFSR